MTTPFGADGTTCDPKNTEKPCDNLYARVMNDPQAVKADVKTDAPTPQTIQVNIVVSQPEQVRDPAHLKVHHNPFSTVARAVGHHGKEYALGVRDSVKPRNLGMETLPIALNEYNAIRIGQGLRQLGEGEQQLGAGLNQLGQQLGALEGAGAGGAGAALRAARVGTVAAHAEIAAAPKLAAHTQIAASIPSEGVAAAPRAATVSVAGETAIATPATAVQLPNGGIMNIAVTTGGGTNGRTAEAQTASANSPLTIDNKVQFLPNEGFNANGDIVAMTPKQMAKAKEFASKSDLEETHLKAAVAQYNTELADVEKAMSTSKNAPSWFKMLDQRMTYFDGSDQQGDHKAARAWLSDAGQCVDYLKRDAQSTHNEDAIRKLEALKRSVKELDGIEKKFGKTPDVILPA
jgi:hypothetical protein